jgi:hypothetical protein
MPDMMATTTIMSAQPTPPAAADEKFQQLYPKPLMLLRLPVHIIKRIIASKRYSVTLTRRELNELPEELRDATCAMRELIARGKVAFPLCVSTSSVKMSLSWRPRPTDIIIATAPKTGTTWIEHGMHLLRTGGDASYADIDEVVPLCVVGLILV